MRHYLLTALGVRLDPVRYRLGSREVDALAAPLGLLELLPGDARPEEVVVILTPKARQQAWDTFRQEFSKRWGGTNVVLADPVDVPEGINATELRQFLEAVAKRFRDPCRLTIDITHGFRHFPFVVYPLVLYLTALRDVQIEGVYYGMYDPLAQGNVWPIVDLTLLAELPEWFYSVRLFRRYGIADALAGLLDALARRIELSGDHAEHQQARAKGAFNGTAKALRHYSYAYGSGLPLELGRAARSVVRKVNDLRDTHTGAGVPLADDLYEIVIDAAERVALPETTSFSGVWKQNIDLNRAELERQARLIERYLERDQLPLAIGLLREWVVSWVLLARNQTSDWLKRDARVKAERYLGAASRLSQTRPAGADVDPRVRQLGAFWQQLTELRNSFAHHGMRPEAVERDESVLEKLRQYWARLRDEAFELPDIGGGAGTLLVSPQGQRRGVLFSAIRTAINQGYTPSSCLVVCSRQSLETLNEAAQAAGFNGTVTPLIINDPFAGFSEIDGLVQEAVPHILKADRVVANLTGGTTLMGIVVQRIVETAQQLAKPVCRFALVDRRPPAEQDANPYVEGEYYIIDSADRPVEAAEGS